MDEPLANERRRTPVDFETLYAQHAPRMRRLLARGGVRSADLDDLLQEVFVIIHRLLPGFEGRSSLETWMHAIAWRITSAYRRRLHRRQEHDLASPDVTVQAASEEPAPGGDDLHALWGSTDPEHRDLFALHHVGGLSIAQLAQLTGHARATISKRIELASRQRARGAALDGSASLASARDAQLRVHEPSLRLMSCRQICLSSLDDFVLGIWRGHCTVESMHALGEAFEHAIAARPDGIRYLAVVEPTSTPPTLEGRQLHAELARSYGPKLRAGASVVEASTMMRLVSGVLNTYFAIARTSVNMRFFTDLPPALQWFARYGMLDAARLSAHVELMRSQLDPPSSR